MQRRRAAVTSGDSQGQTDFSVYDSAEFVGTVPERADGGGFDAVNASGDLLGTFRTRLEASRAIPAGGGQ